MKPAAGEMKAIKLLPLASMVRTGYDDRGRPTWVTEVEEVGVGWVRTKVFARSVGMHPRTINEWISRGVIPQDKWRRVGQRILMIDVSEVARLRDTGDK
jgi:hypothetical protein